MAHTKPPIAASKTGCIQVSLKEFAGAGLHLKEADGLDLKECFVDGTFVPELPQRLIGGKACDSDRLDEWLAA